MLTCAKCASTRFRHSGFRFSDFLPLLDLRLPVRCRDCGERAYARISDAAAIRRADRVRHFHRRQKRA